MYRVLRWLPHALLASHLFFKFVTQDRSIFLDLIVYNAIWVVAVIAIAQSHLSNDPIAVASTCLAITFWGIGSTLNSYGEFYQLPSSAQLFAQASYALFYPCALIAIPRSLVRGRRLNPLELLDSAIFGLGISSIATALFLSRVFPQSLINLQDQFFSLLYPVCDLLLLIIATVALVTHRLQARAVLLFLGIAIFSASDLLFLWLAVSDNYRFGQLTDDGWLLGIVLIASSLWLQQTTNRHDVTIHPVFIALSIFMSPTSVSYTHLTLPTNREV